MINYWLLFEQGPFPLCSKPHKWCIEPSFKKLIQSILLCILSPCALSVCPLSYMSLLSLYYCRRYDCKNELQHCGHLWWNSMLLCVTEWACKWISQWNKYNWTKTLWGLLIKQYLEEINSILIYDKGTDPSLSEVGIASLPTIPFRENAKSVILRVKVGSQKSC